MEVAKATLWHEEKTIGKRSNFFMDIETFKLFYPQATKIAWDQQKNIIINSFSSSAPKSFDMGKNNMK